MKKRKGFHPITVDGIPYQYALSFPAFKAPLVVVYSETAKMEIPLDYVAIPERKDVEPTWRGKHSDKGFGKYEVATLIKHYTKEHSHA